MSLRQDLIKPLVLDALKGHTHTVIFLHRFPQDTSEKELRKKVLSQKLTRDHETLRVQFPTIRWVYPYPKLHAVGGDGKDKHWSSLSAQDNAELGLSNSLPYITQIIMSEAKAAGGLDKVILGGQGETAIAAHGAMSKFPEITPKLCQDPEEMTTFLRTHFHPEWTEVGQLKLGGFVGMHPDNDKPTRDEQDFRFVSKFANQKKTNDIIIKNTPHEFIRGGYKVQTVTWDGRRIDEFAEFLAEVGVPRNQTSRDDLGVKAARNTETLPAKDTSDLTGDNDSPEAKRKMTDTQMHAEEIKKQKRQEQKLKENILKQIEYDKLERKRRQEQERLAREASAQAHDATSSAVPSLPQPPTVDSSPTAEGEDAQNGYEGDSEDDSEGDSEMMTEAQKRRTRKERREKPWTAWASQTAGGDSEWKQRQPGEMSESQMKALGLDKADK